MCQAAKRYLCGGFLGNFEDPHTSPPSSDDEEGGGETDSEAERYMPKHHSKFTTKKSKFGLVGKLKPDRHMLASGWGPYLGTISIEKEKAMVLVRAIVANKSPITEHMLDNLASDDRENHLHTLQLTQCHLKNFPQIGDLHALKVVRLSRNHIRVIKKSALAPKLNVEWLICDYNKLEAIDLRAVSDEYLPNVEVMNLAHNKLAFLPSDFASGMESLRYLDLSCNKLQKLPDSCVTSCHDLQMLYLQNNALASLPAGIGGLTKLRKLCVSYNCLAQLPESIGDCCSLEKLQASSNRITKMPDSIINLWKQRRGSLEELLMGGNPLVQPGLSAFEQGQLDLGFKLFDEWLIEQEEKQRMKEGVAAKPLPLVAPPADGVALPLAIGAPPPSEGMLQAKPKQVSMAQNNDAVHNAAINKSMTLALGDVGLVSDTAEAEVDAQVLDDEAELSAKAGEQMQTSGQKYYFSHLWDANGNEDPAGTADLRSTESMLLLMKKAKYIEAKKNKALTFKNHEEAPHHLRKYLQEGLTAATHHGKVPVTEMDIHFCLLVYATKTHEPTCSALYERYSSSAGDALKWADWDNFCSHTKISLPKEAKEEMWEFMARSSEVIKKRSFIACWHIHDLVAKDPWVRRASRVLNLEYYKMDIGNLREILRAKSACEAEAEAIPSESGDSSDGSGSTSSDSSDFNQGARQLRALEPPAIEGERRMRHRLLVQGSRARPGAPALDAPAARERRSSPRRRQSPRCHTNSSGSLQLNPFSDMKPVSLTEEQHHALVRHRQSDESDAESSESSDSLPSEDLSIKQLTSASSFDGGERLQELESAGEEEMAEKLMMARKHDIQSDADIARLMDMPIEEILRVPPREEKTKHTKFVLKTGTAGQMRMLKPCGTRRESRFRTDVFTVRQAIREAQRNMTAENIITLVNCLLRRLKHIQHAEHPSQSYWHINDPYFRGATGVERINPYAMQLLLQIGFVCINDIYWVWPEKHLTLCGNDGTWGKHFVPASCPGQQPGRLADMVDLFAHYQKSLSRSRVA